MNMKMEEREPLLKLETNKKNKPNNKIGTRPNHQRY